MREPKNDQSEFFATVDQLRLLKTDLEKQLSILKKYLSFLETEAESEETRLLCVDLIKKTEECLKSIQLLNELNDDLTLLREKGSFLFGSQNLGKDLRICPRCGHVQRRDSMFCVSCGTSLASEFTSSGQQTGRGEFGQGQFSGGGPSNAGFGSGGFGQSKPHSQRPPFNNASSGGFGGFGQGSQRPQNLPSSGSQFGGAANTSPGHSIYPDPWMNEPSAKKKADPLSAIGRILAAPFTAAGSLLKGNRNKKDGDREEILPEKVKDEEKDREVTPPGGSGEEITSADRNESVAVSNVEYSAIAPAKMKKGEYSIIHLVMYEEEYRSVAEQILSQSRDKKVETPGGAMDVSHGSKIKITLFSPDIMPTFGDFSVQEERIWGGKYQNFSFPVMIPSQYSRRQVLFEVNIYINNVIASELSFTADIDAEKEQRLSIQRRDILSAFVSYAREDRVRVLSIVQGMRKARRDLDIFMDVKDLQSGDEWEKVLENEIANRDIFYLCWSIAASKSANVEKEWRYALTYKGADCIEPVPIDPPELCPPPEELRNKHFNDNLLYFIDAYGWNRRG